MLSNLFSNKQNKPVIMALGGLFLVLLIAEATYIYLGSKSTDKPKTGPEEEIGLVVAPFFVRLDGLNIPVIRELRVERHLLFSIALEVGDSRARHDVWMALPVLRDAFVRDLHGFVRLIRFEDETNYLTTVKARLHKVCDRVLGPGVVKAVLVQEMNERRIDGG